MCWATKSRLTATVNMVRSSERSFERRRYRFPRPPVLSSRRSMDEQDLEHALRLLVEQRVRLGGPLERQAVRDQALRRQPGQLAERGQEPASLRPAPGALGGEGAHLAADQPEAAAVEAAAEVQRSGLAAVPGADDDAAAEAARLDGGVEPGRVPRELEDEVRSAGLAIRRQAGSEPGRKSRREAFGRVASPRIEARAGAERERGLAAERVTVEGDEGGERHGG